ncbi:MAG: hypothetical protein BWK77_06390, partial [Verrucomicrobia bacterium A1]
MDGRGRGLRRRPCRPGKGARLPGEARDARRTRHQFARHGAGRRQGPRVADQPRVHDRAGPDPLPRRRRKSQGRHLHRAARRRKARSLRHRPRRERDGGPRLGRPPVGGPRGAPP